MSKSLIALLLALCLAGPVWPQEDPSASDAEEPEGAETAEIEKADDIVDPDFEDADLDEQTYEEDEDDFIPSEEIPADEPIPFPSNI